MSLLLVTQPADLRSLLPSGRDLGGWHAALTREIVARLSPAHAAMLARPVAEDGGTGWHAEGARVVPFGALGLAERRALLAAAGSILSDIRRLAEGGGAPAVAACWPALREIPDLGCLFAVDGRPVLAAWGAVPTEAAGPLGLLAAHDDDLPLQRAEPRRWRVPTLMLGALGMLGLVLGLTLARGVRAFPPTACRLAPEQRALLTASLGSATHEAALEGRLQGLKEAILTGRVHCVPRVIPPSVATAKKALPAEAWRQHDLSMLNGCWNRYTNMATVQIFTGRIEPVSAWRLCFDAAGGGEQTIVWKDGATCHNPVRAHFNADGTLTIQDVSECGKGVPGGRTLVVGRMICTRLSASVASCPREDLEGPHAGREASGMFRR